MKKRSCLLIVFLFVLFSFLSEAVEIKETNPLNKNIIKVKKEKIVLDAGHGGKDTGTSSFEGRYEEKNLTLSTVLMVQSQLRRLGYKPYLTRGGDVFVNLNRRAQIANNLKADVFISIHYNYSPNPEALGTEIYVYPNENSSRQKLSSNLGTLVLKFMKKESPEVVSRGIKTANFAVIRETVMPAILIEVGFLSNPKERSRIVNPKFRASLAKGIAEGIDAYLTGKSI